MLAQTHDAGHLRPVISQVLICDYTSTAMPNLLILTEVQESMRARYKAMLLEQFPQLTINVVGHHNDVEPYIADTDILLCFSPPMADHVVRDAPKLKWIQALGTGVDNIVDLPSLGKEVLVTNIRGIHGAPVSEATIAYMLSLARDLPRSVRAQDRSAMGALAVGAARRQDRRHSRRRPDRGISGADLQAVRHDGDRHQRQAARDERLRPHGRSRRSGEGRGRARLSWWRSPR